MQCKAENILNIFASSVSANSYKNKSIQPLFLSLNLLLYSLAYFVKILKLVKIKKNQAKELFFFFYVKTVWK